MKTTIVKTPLKIGDKAWLIEDNKPRQVTISSVDVRYEQKRDEDTNQIETDLSVYYMCEETSNRGSGSTFQLGERIFKTKKECLEHLKKFYLATYKIEAGGEIYYTQLLIVAFSREIAKKTMSKFMCGKKHIKEEELTEIFFDHYKILCQHLSGIDGIRTKDIDEMIEEYE